MPAFSLSHQKAPSNRFSLVPNDAVKRRGAFEGVNPADLLLWMALRATMPKQYRSKAELARIVGSDWNVVRAQLRNLESKGLIRFSSEGIHTVIPDQDGPASQEPTSKAAPPDEELDLMEEWIQAVNAMDPGHFRSWLKKGGSLTEMPPGHAEIFVDDPDPIENDELKGI